LILDVLAQSSQAAATRCVPGDLESPPTLALAALEWWGWDGRGSFQSFSPTFRRLRRWAKASGHQFDLSVKALQVLETKVSQEHHGFAGLAHKHGLELTTPRDALTDHCAVVADHSATMTAVVS